MDTYPRGITDEVRDAMAWAGIEKFVCPLISSLGDKYGLPVSNCIVEVYVVFFRLSDEVSCDFVESIVTSKNVPRAIIYHTTTMLFNRVLATEENSNTDITTARPLLSQIQQRHPSILEKVAEELREVGEPSEEAIEQVVISLSIVSLSCLPLLYWAYFHCFSAQTFTAQVNSSSGSSELDDAIISSANASAQVRTLAVKALLAGLSTAPASSIVHFHFISPTSTNLSPLVRNPSTQLCLHEFKTVTQAFLQPSSLNLQSSFLYSPRALSHISTICRKLCQLVNHLGLCSRPTLGFWVKNSANTLPSHRLAWNRCFMKSSFPFCCTRSQGSILQKQRGRLFAVRWRMELGSMSC
jgi:hypothetical protein